jgi:hypothetical protein
VSDEKRLCAFPVGPRDAEFCLRVTCGFPTDQHPGRAHARETVVEMKPRPRGRRA